MNWGRNKENPRKVGVYLTLGTLHLNVIGKREDMVLSKTNKQNDLLHS